MVLCNIKSHVIYIQKKVFLELVKNFSPLSNYNYVHSKKYINIFRENARGKVHPRRRHQIPVVTL